MVTYDTDAFVRELVMLLRLSPTMPLVTLIELISETLGLHVVMADRLKLSGVPT